MPLDNLAAAVSDIDAALNAIKAQWGEASADLAKATGTFVQPGSATTGLQAYNLEPAAKNLYPVYSPLRNEIPRVGVTGGTQANWKAVTAIDTGIISIGVGEGNRGALIAQSVADYFAVFKTIGAEASVTVEAELSAEGFDDLKARAVRENLEVLMQGEERLIMGGNTSTALGTTPNVTLSTATTGGTIAASTTVSVIAVALTMDGLLRCDSKNGPQWTVTRQNADGSNETYGGGAAAPGSSVTIATGGGTATNTVTASIANPPAGAVGYAWYAGPVGQERLVGSATPTSKITITAIPANTQALLPSGAIGNDASTNALYFDGLLTLAAKTVGSYWKTFAPGATMTSDGQGGIVEIDAVLQWYWDTLRMSPSRMIIASNEQLSMRKCILQNAASGAPSRFVFYADQNKLVGGSIPKGYLNPFANGTGPTEISLQLHPFMPPGTIIFLADRLPYAMNNVPVLRRILCRKDYYQYSWPMRSRKYEFGLYSDQVLQDYFPVAIAVLTNITPGVTAT